MSKLVPLGNTNKYTRVWVIPDDTTTYTARSLRYENGILPGTAAIKNTGVSFGQGSGSLPYMNYNGTRIWINGNNNVCYTYDKNTDTFTSSWSATISAGRLSGRPINSLSPWYGADVAFVPSSTSLGIYDFASGTLIKTFASAAGGTSINGAFHNHTPNIEPTSIGATMTYSGETICLTPGSGTTVKFVNYTPASGTGMTISASFNGPGNLPSSPVTTKWSPDGQIIAFGGTTSPYLVIWVRSSSTTFNAATLPLTPGGVIRGLAWSPDGTKLAISYGASPYIYIFKRNLSDNTFTNITPSWTGSNLPAAQGPVAYDVLVWHSDNNILIASGPSSSTTSQLYQLDTTAGTSLAAPYAIQSGVTYNTRLIAFYEK